MAGKPNILVIWGDDIGYWNISAYSKGMMGYKTPNIDRIANEGMTFTDCYGEQSCTAGRSAFIIGQGIFRTGLSKVGLPGAEQGMRAEDPTIAELLKPLGYATGQFGKNHLGDRDVHLPTMHELEDGRLGAASAGHLPDLGEAVRYIASSEDVQSAHRLSSARRKSRIQRLRGMLYWQCTLEGTTKGTDRCL